MSGFTPLGDVCARVTEDALVDYLRPLPEMLRRQVLARLTRDGTITESEARALVERCEAAA